MASALRAALAALAAARAAAAFVTATAAAAAEAATAALEDASAEYTHGSSLLHCLYRQVSAATEKALWSDHRAPTENGLMQHIVMLDYATSCLRPSWPKLQKAIVAWQWSS